MKGFIIFEKIRDNNGGGGLISIIHENLKPIQIFVLSRFYKHKNKTTVVTSDHNLLVLQMSLKWSQKIVADRKEIYNLNNQECQKEFLQNTSNNKNLIEVLKNQDIVKSGRKWLKELNHEIAKSFNKIRISKKAEKLDNNMRSLFLMREKLKLKISNPGLSNEALIKDLEAKLQEIEKKIAEIIAESNYKIVKENLEYLVDSTEKLNHINMWQLKKKICRKKSEVPTGKKNVDGELVTETTKLKELYKTTYKTRLQHREMKPQLMNMFDKKMELFNIRLQVCKNIKSSNWTEDKLLKVLKSVKNNKSADSFGLIYELFKPGVIGTDLLTSLLMVCNKVKNELLITYS